MIIINFKNYKKGKAAVELAKKIQKYLHSAIVCVNVLDVKAVSRAVKLKVFTQKVAVGQSFNVKVLGGKGSLLNHSDHPVSFDKIKKIIAEARKEKIKIVLCAASVAEARKFKRLKPWAIAFEDKKLIGTGRSITEYKSDAVAKFAKMLKGTGIVPLCGAGISSVEDVRAARKLGCRGVLIASAIAKSKDPERLLRELGKI